MPLEEISLDLTGLKCPLPALLLERALRAAASGSIVVAIATDPMAEVDLPFSAQRLGATVLDVQAGSGAVRVRVLKK